MFQLSLNGERVFTLAEIAELEGKPMRTVQWRAAQRWLRVIGGPYGRVAKESEVRRYFGKLGLDFDTLIAAREAAEEARAEVLARRADAQAERHLEQLTNPDTALDLCQGVR